MQIEWLFLKTTIIKPRQLNDMTVRQDQQVADWNKVKLKQKREEIMILR